MQRKTCLLLFLLLVILSPVVIFAEGVSELEEIEMVEITGETALKCLDCHSKVTPGIVADWKASKHYRNKIDCSICHGSEHVSAQDVAKAKIPTPQTCSICHSKQVEQFRQGKHAYARAAMNAVPTIHWQPAALTEGMKGCGGCHKIGLKSEEEIKALNKRAIHSV